MNDSNEYIMNIIDSKTRFHKNRAKTPYEEKLKIILELQKINEEMRSKRNIKNNKKNNKVWDVIL